MISPKLKEGDLVIENGELVMIEGDEELVQSVLSVLQTRKGEFFLVEEHGVFLDNLLGKEANQEEARDDIIEAISQDERIASVEDVTFADDRKDRIRSVSLKLRKADSDALMIEGVDFNA